MRYFVLENEQVRGVLGKNKVIIWSSIFVALYIAWLASTLIDVGLPTWLGITV